MDKEWHRMRAGRMGRRCNEKGAGDGNLDAPGTKITNQILPQQEDKTMYYNLDLWTQKKAYVMELYLQGKSPAIISGLTGVPRIRIERELNRLTEHRPELLSMHLAAQYKEPPETADRR